MHKVAEIKLLYQPKPIIRDSATIKSSKDAELVLFKEDEISLRECFFALCLNRNNRVIASYQVSSCGVSGSVADNKLIFACALLTAASSIIVSHNHPSGNLTPSRADEELTKR